ISFAFFAIFRRFADAHHFVFDKLSACSYGIYLVHYPIVVWLQFTLLALVLSPLAKAGIVYAGAATLTWNSVGTPPRSGHRTRGLVSIPPCGAGRFRCFIMLPVRAGDTMSVPALFRRLLLDEVPADPVLFPTCRIRSSIFASHSSRRCCCRNRRGSRRLCVL